MAETCVFDPGGLKRGDVLEYPAILRPEHRFVRSRSVVESVDGRGAHVLIGRDNAGVPDKRVITTAQITENGVVVIGRAADKEDT